MRGKPIAPAQLILAYLRAAKSLSCAAYDVDTRRFADCAYLAKQKLN